MDGCDEEYAYSAKLKNCKRDNQAVLKVKKGNFSTGKLNSFRRKYWKAIKIFATHSFMCLLVSVHGVSSDAVDNNTSISVNQGEDIELPCEGKLEKGQGELSWRFSGKINSSGLSHVQPDTGALYITQTSSSDAGTYICSKGEKIISIVELKVESVPSRVINMSVHTNTVFAVVSWKSVKREEHTLKGFQCKWRQDTSHMVNPGPRDKKYSKKLIDASSTTCPIYNLSPNTTYFFQVAAFNERGLGKTVSLMETTKPVLESTVSALNTSKSPLHGRVLLIISLAVSVLALSILGSGIALLLVKHRCSQSQPVRPLQEEPTWEEESLELVPHNITLNPSFNIEMLEHITDTESSELAFLVTNIAETGREESINPEEAK